MLVQEVPSAQFLFLRILGPLRLEFRPDLESLVHSLWAEFGVKLADRAVEVLENIFILAEESFRLRGSFNPLLLLARLLKGRLELEVPFLDVDSSLQLALRIGLWLSGLGLHLLYRRERSNILLNRSLLSASIEVGSRVGRVVLGLFPRSLFQRPFGEWLVHDRVLIMGGFVI